MNTTLTRATVADLKPHRPLCLRPDSTTADAIQCMQANQTGCLVVTKGERLIGIVTERDILKKLIARDADPTSVPVTNVMSRDPGYLFEEDSAAYALNRMSVGGYRHIAVLDKSGIPCGILTVEDILDHIIANMDL